MNTTLKVLLVEDEQMLAEIISDTLGNHNFEITLAHDGQQAVEIAGKSTFDVIVSDIMMPNMDGFTLVKKLRSEGLETPVLFLTARSATEDIVKGFGIGGNDYLKKPFAMDELIVRIRALAGRAHNGGTVKKESYTLGKYTFMPQNNTLANGSNTVKLAARESAVLEQLCSRMGQTVEASAILKTLWGNDNFFTLRSLNVYITKLRNHFKDDPSIEIISIRGVGYRMEVMQ